MSWRARAACAGEHNNHLFFPTEGGKTAKARALCTSCPVKQDCLDFAVAELIWDGVWGGLNGAERRTYAKTGIIPEYYGVGRRLSFETDCLFPTTASCGMRSGYAHGCRGEHCLARERAARVEKRQRMKERAHAHQPDLSHDQADRTC